MKLSSLHRSRLKQPGFASFIQAGFATVIHTGFISFILIRFEKKITQHFIQIFQIDKTKSCNYEVRFQMTPQE